MRKRVALCLLSLTGACVSNGLMAADIAAGESAYNGKACIGCHGAGGKSQIDIYPALAEKSAGFITDELNKFRSQERVNPTMNAMASGLSDVDISNIAAYLASQ